MSTFFSRSFSDDPNYHPQWRSLQARQYVRDYEEARTASPPRPYFIPNREDDHFVIEYFNLLTLGDCNDDSVKYAHSCNESNSTKGFGTMIQAMMIGGKDLQDIARELGTSLENVDAYVKIFFDVEEYLDKDLFVSSLICPFSKDENTFSTSRQSYMWLGLSYAFGWDKAKYLLQRRLDVDASTVKMFEEVMQNLVNMQAAEFVTSIRSGGVARPADFERYIANTNATAMSAAMKTESVSQSAQGFRSALFGLIANSSQSLPESHPVKAIMREKMADARVIEVKDNNAKKKFGNFKLKHL